EALMVFGSVTGRDPRSLGAGEQVATALGIGKSQAGVLQETAYRTLSQEAHKTRTVVLIVSDGLRWQEVVQGGDPLLLDAGAGGSWLDAKTLKQRYWRDTPQERRRILFPFLWDVVAAKGQIFGNRTLGSDAHVTNGVAFSYPGYNEMTVGFPNPKITSNE